MKKLLVVMVITLMMTSGAYALQTDWQVDFNFINTGGPVQMGVASIGAVAGISVDGVDGYDGAYVPALADTLELDIINGAMGARSQFDFIDIPSAATDVDLWTLKAFKNSAATGASFQLQANFMDYDGAYPLTDPDFNIYLFAGQLTKEQCAAATPIWSGSMANYADFKTGFVTPQVALTAGGAQYYTLWAGAAIPEPGSMLALFSGLVGLVGFGIRRRR